MTVTALTPVTKTRTRVVIDEDQTLVLSNKELTCYGLEEGQEIPETVWEEMKAALRSSALRKCGKLLQGMDYSRKGLHDKLVRSGYPAEIADEAVDKMVTAGYVNDRRFAENYLKYHSTDRSLTRIRQDLYQKGVAKELIGEVLLSWVAENPEEAAGAEEGQIRRLMEKRGYDPDTADYEDTCRMVAYLMQKGYSMSAIREVMQ